MLKTELIAQDGFACPRGSQQDVAAPSEEPPCRIRSSPLMPLGRRCSSGGWFIVSFIRAVPFFLVDQEREAGTAFLPAIPKRTRGPGEKSFEQTSFSLWGRTSPAEVRNSQRATSLPTPAC
jgi:hypothetical protein